MTNNPATVDQNQQLLVRFPNLGADDVIVPGTARLAFTISLSSTDANRTLVQNIGRAICKRMTIHFSGNEVMSIDDSDVYYCYQDLWKTARERENAQYQGIDTTADRNATKLRVGAGDAANVPADKAISEAYGNRFFVPLDFEILESHMPFYQAGLGDRLEYELTFNEYGSTVQTTAASTSYTVENISLEFDKVTNAELARLIRSQYASRFAILYERILRHRKLRRDKSDSLEHQHPSALHEGTPAALWTPRLPSSATRRPSTTPRLRKLKLPSRASRTSSMRRACAHTSSGTRPESFTQAAPSGTP